MDNIKSFHKTVDNAGCLMETEEIPHSQSPLLLPLCCGIVESVVENTRRNFLKNAGYKSVFRET